MLKHLQRPSASSANTPSRRPALGIQRSSADSERRADVNAHVFTGRAPEHVGDPRARALEGTDVPGPVQALIESQQGAGPGVRAVPEGVGTALGPRAQRARLHTDTAAGIAARAVGAQAFAANDDIFFAQGRYQPNTDAGRALIVHELTHVLEGPNPSRIARTPGVAYPNEREAAEAAFSYLLEKHKDALDSEWGGYIYRMSDEGTDAFFHSEARTDGDPHTVNSNTERYARAAVEDAQIEYARAPGSSSKPKDFKPTPGWVEPEDVQKRGGIPTATYHIHPSMQNKVPGFSDEVNNPSRVLPYGPKRSGDIPLALSKGLNSYMIDLDESAAATRLGHPLHEYIVANHQADKQGLDSIAGIIPTLGNAWKCQFGFNPDGTVDDGPADRSAAGPTCKDAPPDKEAMKEAEKIVASRQFAVGVATGDISQWECLRMLKAADRSEDVAVCGIDSRTPEQRRREELERMMQIFERLQGGQVTAHDWL